MQRWKRERGWLPKRAEQSQLPTMAEKEQKETRGLAWKEEETKGLSRRRGGRRSQLVEMKMKVEVEGRCQEGGRRKEVAWDR